jgi:hypothetical protein
MTFGTGLSEKVEDLDSAFDVGMGGRL